MRRSLSHSPSSQRPAMHLGGCRLARLRANSSRLRKTDCEALISSRCEAGMQHVPHRLLDPSRLARGWGANHRFLRPGTKACFQAFQCQALAPRHPSPIVLAVPAASSSCPQHCSSSPLASAHRCRNRRRMSRRHGWLLRTTLERTATSIPGRRNQQRQRRTWPTSSSSHALPTKPPLLTRATRTDEETALR